jgi:hypothetical protein
MDECHLWRGGKAGRDIGLMVRIYSNDLHHSEDGHDEMGVQQRGLGDGVDLSRGQPESERLAGDE